MSNMLTNIHDALLNSNFCDEGGNPIKPRIIKDSTHIAYVDKGDRMTVSYLI
jgi:hypothetical protein